MNKSDVTKKKGLGKFLTSFSDRSKLKERSRYLKVAGADVGNTPVREMFFKFRATILGHSSDKLDGKDPEIELSCKDSCWILFI
jgi:hypothetical protein